jgi:hypothetical protein
LPCYKITPPFPVIKLNESFDRLERGHETYVVFTPCGHDKKNAASRRRSEIEVTLPTFDALYAKVHWIVEDSLVSLVGQNDSLPPFLSVPLL